jgi:hypothetical protein
MVDFTFALLFFFSLFLQKQRSHCPPQAHLRLEVQKRFFQIMQVPMYFASQVEFHLGISAHLHPQ